jgi:predicted phosphodiesterase
LSAGEGTVLTIGVVSDTHLPRFGQAMPPALERGLRAAAVDLILHLGDLTGPEVPAWFEAIAPFEAVAGNNDGETLRARYGRRRLLTLDGGRHGPRRRRSRTYHAAAGARRVRW